MRFEAYQTDGFFDELFEGDGRPRAAAGPLVTRLSGLGAGELAQRQQAAERRLLNLGITFNVYGSGAGTEKIMPFDIVPRIIEAGEWERIERGLKQRIYALNAFLDDIYHDQKILRDGVIPADLVLSSKCFRPEIVGFRPPRGHWCHITGTDLVRDRDGTVYVLEDNLRCPSGASYVLENRQIMKRTFASIFDRVSIRPVGDYPSRLLDMLQKLAPGGGDREATVVLMTPGMYNSAYFEHSFLARQMGVQLVEGRDLVVVDGEVRMRTTQGFQRVDVIYRRIDDDYLDPLMFRPDSRLGVPGLMQAYMNGKVALANAPGTGVADDKAVYAYVPRIVKYYLGEEPVLPNVPTYLCGEEEDRAYVLDNLDKLVVKAANESGGYGMLIGPHASVSERSAFAERIRATPRNYIAQPTLGLSRVPCLVDGQLEGRHVDLRPYILLDDPIWVLPGGLTRVALKRGSLVVNSSQGGGSKDTWVLADASDGQPATRASGRAYAAA